MRQLGGTTQRVPAIDIARAIIIVGVVFSHAIDGLVGAGIIDDSSMIVSVNDALYIFRMPSLAFVLGLLIPNAMAKRGRLGYVKERTTFVLYLYIVWFFTQTLAEILTSSIKNTPRTWTDMLDIWSMPAHLWFLPYVALSAVVVATLTPYLDSGTGWCFLGLVAVLGVLFWGNSPQFFGLRGLSLLMFSLAGAMIGLNRMGRILAHFPWRCVAVGCTSILLFVPAFGLWMVPSTINTQGHSLLVSAFSVAGAVLGVVAVIGLAVALSYVRLLRGALTAIGARTLEIYLAHVAVVAGVRIGLDRLGVVQPGLFILASLVVGVALPMLVAFLAPRLGLTWFFRPPARLDRWSKSSNHDAARDVARENSTG